MSGKTVTADKILIATGNRPTRDMGTDHAIPGGELCITSNEAFHLKELPKRILIAGGGYIAVEFAHIFHGLGSEVTLVYRGDKPLRGFDEDMRDALYAVDAGRAASRSLAHSQFTMVEKRGDCLHAETNKGEVIECDQIMLAIGRDAQHGGAACRKGGRRTGQARRGEGGRLFRAPSAPHIYAVGDVTDRVQLTPVAIHEAMCFVETAFKNNPTKPDHMHVPSAVFSTPELGGSRPDRDKALQAGHSIDVYKSVFRPLLHTLGGRDVRTHMKMIVDSADRQGAGLPHLRRSCRRDHPGRRRRAEDGRHQGGFRRHHRAASHRRRRTGDDAHQKLQQDALSSSYCSGRWPPSRPRRAGFRGPSRSCRR